MTIPVTIIVGPTACGKTAKAIALAKAKGRAEIINADSVQTFIDLPILTARPTLEEQAGIPHHMFGILEPSDQPSVKWWIEHCAEHIMEIHNRGNYPIIVGGTGFYIDALINGLSEIPNISQTVKDNVSEIMQSQSNEQFYETVTMYDPLISDIKPNDRQRLQRALEVFFESGKSLRFYQGHKKKLINTEPLIDYIDIDRDILYARVNRRFELMMENGAIEEVRHLRNRGIPKNAPVMHAIGAMEIFDYLDNLIPLENVIIQAKQFSRNYAKRQITWFNNQLRGKL